MQYPSEVSTNEQIKLDQFPLRPGDEVLVVFDGSPYKGIVVEIGAANPEYVTSGPTAEGAEAFRWTKETASDFETFLQEGHLPVKLRLKKSMWATLEFSKPIPSLRGVGISISTIILYTYDILSAQRRGHLFKRSPETEHRFQHGRLDVP